MESLPAGAAASDPFETIAPLFGNGLVLQDNALLLCQPDQDVRNVPFC